jgi:hypothetical protein
LRNKTENGVHYRYCKGCGWQKAIKEQTTVDSEMAEIDEQIKTRADVKVPDEIQVPPEPPKSVGWMEEASKKIAEATGIPAEIMQEMTQGRKITVETLAGATTVTAEFSHDEFEKQQKAAAEEHKGAVVQEVPEPLDTGSSGEQKIQPQTEEPVKPTLEQVAEKVSEKHEEKPKKKDFFSRLFGK